MRSLGVTVHRSRRRASDLSTARSAAGCLISNSKGNLASSRANQ
jgi:hypothetical protein